MELKWTDRPGEPIACSLDQDGRAAQVEAFEAIAATALLRRERTGEGARLWFAPGAAVDASLRSFLAVESECCRFFDFALEAERGALRLDVRAPAEAMPLVAALFLGERQASV